MRIVLTDNPFGNFYWCCGQSECETEEGSEGMREK